MYMYDTYMYVGHTYINQKVFYSWCQRWEFSLILKISYSKEFNSQSCFQYS